MTEHRRFKFFTGPGAAPVVVALPIYYTDEQAKRALSHLQDMRPRSYWEEIVKPKEQEVPSKRKDSNDL